jgi:hypothetical protein
MRRCVGSLAEAMAVFGSTTLTGVACCGPLVIQWIGFLVWAAGGRALLMALVHNEVPVLLIVAAASSLASALAGDRLIRLANMLLASTALLLAVLRLVWDVRRGLVMAIEPVYQLFIYRQAVLLAVAGLVGAIRLAILIVGRRSRACSGLACPFPKPRHGRSQPSWT